MVSRAGHAGLSEGAAAEEGCVCRAQCVDIPRAQAWEAMRSMYIFRDPRNGMWGASEASRILSDAADWAHAKNRCVLSVVAKYEQYCVRARCLVGHNTLTVRFDEAEDLDLRSQMKCH